MQTFEQIKLVKTRIWYSCLNKLIDIYIKSRGAEREAGSPEWWIFPLPHCCTNILTDFTVQQDMHESSGGFLPRSA